MSQTEETQGVESQAQSVVLSEEEVSTVVQSEEGTLPESTEEGKEVILPSDQSEVEIPEKFKDKSPEEIIKAYQELEKKLGEKQPDEKKEETPSEEPEEPEKEPVPITPEEYKSFEQKYYEQGGLSDEDYAALEAKGIPRDVVDQEIAWREFQEQQAIKKVVEPIGLSQTDLQEVVTWARETKSEDDIQAFNEALSSSNTKGQQALVKALWIEYKASTNQSLDLHTRSRSPGKPSKGYSNESEFLADISNPAYGKDKSYVAAVEAKLASSNTDGWGIFGG
ncbi:MAG: hypothetical protein B6U76_00090 [Desulfurococcales archaeon ex4484_217_2]|nr:MAG: hypothetical protein B6U76_00090 [Desulfurococcales archaeon ex4484_217_2]